MRRAARRIVVDFAELSDRGLDPSKQVNEDFSGFAETDLGLLSVVCDGMGGHTQGREASETAVRAILSHVQAAAARSAPAELLRAAVQAAGKAVFALGGTAPEQARPGSTCVAALLTEQGVTVAHVGDSRLMLIRGGHLTRLTRDHTMVRELVDAGMLTEAEAASHPEANKITRALGMTPEVAVQLGPAPVELHPDDVLLLTSDGVTDLVSDEELVSVVQKLTGRGATAVCQELIRLGKSRGGHDNMTVQLLHVLKVPTAATRASSTRPVAGQTVLLEEDQAGAVAPATKRMGDTPANQGRAAQPTLPDRAGVQPTVLDEPPRVAGPTVVDHPPAAAPGEPPGAVALPSPREPPAAVASIPRRTLLRAAALGAFLVIGVALAWWGRHSISQQSQDLPPPPAPEPSPREVLDAGGKEPPTDAAAEQEPAGDGPAETDTLQLQAPPSAASAAFP